jgi:hypothetical protein
MRISLIATVLLAALTGCSKPPASKEPAPPPSPTASVLSLAGYGPIRFGAKLSEVEQQLAMKSDPLGENDPACSSVRFKRLPGARFMIENGVITRADADAGTVNSLGLAVGDSLAQAKEKVPALEIGPHKYLPAGHYLTVKSPDTKAAIIIEEDGNAITKIRAGLQPSVAYVEVCL